MDNAALKDGFGENVQFLAGREVRTLNPWSVLGKADAFAPLRRQWRTKLS
jgi:hypothetical protein